MRHAVRAQLLTLIAALGTEAIRIGLLGHWYTNGELFLEFTCHCLVPVLKAGDTVIMDNLNTHKVVGVKQVIESAGAQLIYLPPYSPDLSPIELCWSTIKNHQRKKAARDDEELHLAICEAFKTVTQSDIENWFAHCGYHIH